ncbi:MAG: hypothetical protein JWO78_1783 [Micavibrio sp.]|nr:hypothetical protein [Micavibrio sp.]
MAIDQKTQDDQFAAKKAADDASFLQRRSQEDAKFQADKAQSEKVFTDRKAEEAGAPARQAQQDAANRGIVGGVLGAVGVVAGIGLMNKLEGVIPMATLSGAQNGNVIQGVAQQNGFNVASMAAGVSTGLQNTMNTAMNFLTPPKQNGP